MSGKEYEPIIVVGAAEDPLGDAHMTRLDSSARHPTDQGSVNDTIISERSKKSFPEITLISDLEGGSVESSDQSLRA